MKHILVGSDLEKKRKETQTLEFMIDLRVCAKIRAMRKRCQQTVELRCMRLI